MDAPLMVDIILRTKGNVKENRRKFRGKFTERKRNISDLVHEIFTKLYIQSQSRLKYHAIRIFPTIPLYHIQIPMSNPNFVQ